MRARIDPSSVDQFLKNIKISTGLTLDQLAKTVHLSGRTLRDWANGKYTPKLEIIQHFAATYNVPTPPITKQLDDFWYTVQAGKMGGRAVIKKHGPPYISLETRRRAGFKAFLTRLRRGDQFFLRKEFSRPPYNEKLAEFIGIILGDGAITPTQITITLHRIDDAVFIKYVKTLIKSLFAIEASIREREMVKNIVISRIGLVEFLTQMGLPIGSKVRHQVDVPSWIKNNSTFARACIRGLYDTDGSFYIDIHRYKNKIYKHCAVNFTNRSLPLLYFFKQNLEMMGLHPVQTSRYAVALRRKDEIVTFFNKINPSNSKHWKKMINYCFEKYGEVA